MPDEFRDLVKRCLAGDQAATVDLVDRYRGQVFGLCYRMLGHRQDAEDVTQETLLRALRNLARWDSTREFRPWLFAIAGNRCRTWLAARKRRPRPATLLEDTAADARPLPESRDALLEEVNLALEKIRRDHRVAFLLFHEQEMNYAEISEAMSCPLGTAKTWVHRARREVARQLLQRGVVEHNVAKDNIAKHNVGQTANRNAGRKAR